MRLGWGVRRYWWSLLLLPVLLAAAGGATWARADWSPEYEAHALVVATAVNLRAAELPPLVEAVFEAGTVAESVVTGAGLTIEPQRLIPSRASAEPLGDGLATRVSGRAADAETAASIANTAADALVAELTELGPAIASFRVHDRARPPLSASNERPGLAVHVGLGAALGLFLALLIISVHLAVRRPLTHPQQVTSLLEVPVIGTVEPPGRWRTPSGRAASTSGIGTLAGKLAARDDTLALTAIRGQERLRSQLAVGFAQHLAHLRPTTVISSDPEVTQASASSRDAIGENPTSHVPVSPGETGRDQITIYDGDLDDPSRGDVRTYLVLREGTPRLAVEFEAIDQPATLDGVIWVCARPRPSHRRVLESGGSPEPVQEPVTARGTTDEGRRGGLERRQPGQHEAR